MENIHVDGHAHKQLKRDSNTFTIEEVFTLGWNSVKKNWKILLGMGLIMFVVEFVFGSLSSLNESLLKDSVAVMNISQIVFAVVYYVIYFWLSYNAIKMILNLMRDGGERVANIFHYDKDTAKRVTNFFLASLAYGVVVLIGTLLLIIPGIYFGTKYQFVQYLVVDKNMDIFEAFKKSAEMTEGEIWHLIGLSLVCFLTILLGLLALLVGIIPAIMLVTMVHLFTYKVLLSKINH